MFKNTSGSIFEYIKSIPQVTELTSIIQQSKWKKLHFVFGDSKKLYLKYT